MTLHPASSRPTLPLALAAPGDTVRLAEIRLPDAEKQRLHELGLLPGSTLRVVHSSPGTGLIVSVRSDGRLALNRSTAHRLLVWLEE
ncbi:MAG: FeoA family protein [Candidatus Flexifilum sp.]|jgi:Fe2+ transport system protein FeoA